MSFSNPKSQKKFFKKICKLNPIFEIDPFKKGNSESQVEIYQYLPEIVIRSIFFFPHQETACDLIKETRNTILEGLIWQGDFFSLSFWSFLTLNRRKESKKIVGYSEPSEDLGIFRVGQTNVYHKLLKWTLESEPRFFPFSKIEQSTWNEYIVHVVQR